MTLKDFISTLEEQKQYSLALELLEKALPIWDNYARLNKLEYIDSVVAMHHTVDRGILSRTLKVVRQEANDPETQKRQINKLRAEFTDPIVAMQDLDWELPYPVERIFYAVYNLLGKISGEETTVFDEPQLYVVINQAIDALLRENLISDEEVNVILKKYKTRYYEM